MNNICINIGGHIKKSNFYGIQRNSEEKLKHYNDQIDQLRSSRLPTMVQSGGSKHYSPFHRNDINPTEHNDTVIYNTRVGSIGNVIFSAVGSTIITSPRGRIYE
jgi:hypothetical protein